MTYTRKQAWELLTTYNEGDFHLKHARTMEDVMRWFAIELGYETEADKWAIVGLLHDLDFEQFPDEHCIREQELMRDAGVPDDIIRSCASHGFGITVDIEPEHQMEKVLYATDELTGLIGATILMRPSKSIQDLTVKSVKKKFKDKSFAAGCDRTIIQRGADMLGWELADLMDKTITAMKTSDVVD